MDVIPEENPSPQWTVEVKRKIDQGALKRVELQVTDTAPKRPRMDSSESLLRGTQEDLDQGGVRPGMPDPVPDGETAQVEDQQPEQVQQPSLRDADPNETEKRNVVGVTEEKIVTRPADAHDRDITVGCGEEQSGAGQAESQQQPSHEDMHQELVAEPEEDQGDQIVPDPSRDDVVDEQPIPGREQLDLEQEQDNKSGEIGTTQPPSPSPGGFPCRVELTSCIWNPWRGR